MATQQRQRYTAASIAVPGLAVLLGIVLVQLFIAPDGLRKTRELHVAVADTRAANAALEQRNKALAGEVRNLKHGLEAAEERARSDLGMIGENESFYQIIDDDDVAESTPDN